MQLDLGVGVFYCFGVGLLQSRKFLFMSLPDIQRALAALREIQVKAVELPPNCEHDGHVIAALAVTVEQILSREIKDAA